MLRPTRCVLLLSSPDLDPVLTPRTPLPQPDQDMLTALQNQEYKSGEPLTDKQIAHIMIALLMAGQHTSAATGAWAILRLGENQDLQRRLYDEQVEHYLDKETGQLRDLEYETLQTPLLNAFIKELLRVHPPLHSLMRKIISDCPVPATVGAPAAEPRAPSAFKKRTEGLEYVVPKGEYVLAAPGYSQLDEQIWGADAKQFRVERWLEEGDKVPGDEDEGEEDYGWGKISKGGKSACECALDSTCRFQGHETYSPLFCAQTSPSAPDGIGAFSSNFSKFLRKTDLPLRPSQLHRRAVCVRPARRHHRHARPREHLDARPAVPRQRLLCTPFSLHPTCDGPGADARLPRADHDCHARQAQEGHLHEARGIERGFFGS